VSQPDLAQISKHFLGYVVIRGLSPEPLEQLRYLTTITIISISMFLICLFWKNVQGKLNRTFLLLAALCSQICFFGWILEREIAELIRRETIYFNDFSLSTGYWFVSICYVFYPLFKNKIKHKSTFLNNSLPILIGVIYLAIQLSTGFFQSGDLNHLANGVHYHMTFTMGEFAAVLNERTLLVDVFPQYQNLMSYFLAPVFKLIGLSVSSFTFVMTMLSFVALMAWFATLKKITKNNWIALCLFLPIVAMSCLSIDMKENIFRNNFFTYHAVANLRSFGPWILCFLCVWYLETPSKFRFLVISIFSSLVAINNIDFGIPAFIATFFAISMNNDEMASGVSGWFQKKSLKLFVKYAIISFLVFSFYCLFTFFKSGSFPNLTQLFSFQKIFAISGFYMLRIPRVGFQWNIMLTFLVSLVVALARVEYGANKTSDERKVNGLLMYLGIFGAGSFMYYVGRSHPQVLMSFFPIWTFTFVILFWLQFESLRKNYHNMDLKDKFLSLPLTVFILMHFCLFLFATTCIPKMIDRMYLKKSVISSQYDLMQSSLVEKIRKYSNQGEQVGIIYPMGFSLAVEANVINVFPFIQDESLLIKEQVEMAIKLFEEKNISMIYGKFPSEMRLILESKKYTKIDSIEDFEVWKKI
jgi:hypothetical protein